MAPWCAVSDRARPQRHYVLLITITFISPCYRTAVAFHLIISLTHMYKAEKTLLQSTLTRITDAAEHSLYCAINCSGGGEITPIQSFIIIKKNVYLYDRYAVTWGWRIRSYPAEWAWVSCYPLSRVIPPPEIGVRSHWWRPISARCAERMSQSSCRRRALT